MTVAPNPRGQTTGLVRRTRLRRALESEQRRADEELACDERRHRVAGQTEHERPPSHAERHRLPGLDGDPPEDLLDTELTRDAANEIVRPDRDTAGRDND